MVTHFADTSAILHQDGLINPSIDLAISPLTVSELEKIKDYDDNEKIRYKAREAVRSIMTNNRINVIMPNNKKIDKLLNKYTFLSNINDHRILCAAELLAIEQDKNVIFITSDALQYLFAQQLPHLEPVYPMGEEILAKNESDWAGWGKYYPNEKDMALLYSDPKMNILKCKTNEFAEIYEGAQLKDILFWNGTATLNKKCIQIYYRMMKFQLNYVLAALALVNQCLRKLGVLINYKWVNMIKLYLLRIILM